MATVYTPDSLRNLFQSSFNLAQWYSFLQHFFNATELKSTPERIIGNTSDEGYYMGNIDTTDSYRIGLFHYNIRQGTVANKRVGLRNLVKSFINPTWGEFDAALVVFDSSDHWRLSFICDIKGEATSPKRYTYVFGSDDLLYRTPIERFNFLKKKGISFENLKTAFSVEALSDEFFDRYREQYADFIQYATGKRFVKVGSKWEEKVLGESNAALMQAFNHDEKKIRDYVKKMMGRITFLHFSQRKGWMCGDLNYMQNMFENSAYKNDYLDSVLEPLFFGILNTKPAEREALFANYGWDNSLLAEWKDIPYLNGGLFERDAEDEPESRFPADYFKRLFQFFSEYNFTIDENDPNDAEVGVDPEMLGKIFENLLEDNKDKGAFYTPKEIVRYMCQESLIAYLETNTSVAKDKIRQFVLSPEEGVADIPEAKKPKLLTALEEVKICDPAIGSGAFPMGLLNELLHCREVLSGTHYDRAEIKKSIIQNNIYGVDIEKGAVDIARLRFWLSIVVDEETSSPLPNLDYKIMQGNSLIESFMGVDLSKLTYEKEYKEDKGEISLFDDEKNRLQKTVLHLLSSYYSCSDHDRKVKLQKEISDTINKQLEAQAYDPTILAQLKDINLAENNKFFLWHTWFADVFNRPSKQGFDIVIGNPPYFKYEGTHKGEIATLRRIGYLKAAFGGKLNAYKLFLALAIKHLAKKSGIITYIFQNSFLGDLQAAVLRKTTIEENQPIVIDSFPERDSKKKRVFESVKMSVCILLMKTAKTKESFKVNFWNDKFKSSGTLTCFDAEEIKAIDPIGYIVPRIETSQKQLVIKLKKLNTLPLKCFEGELNMTFHKKYFIDDKSAPKVLKGASIQRYYITENMSQGEIEHLNESDFLSENTGEKSQHHTMERIAMQGMTGANDKVRIIMSIVPSGYYLANSCNYLLPNDEYPAKYLIGLLNSKLINWFFRIFSTNSNVNGYEVEQFPLPVAQENDKQRLIHLVEQIHNKKEINPYADTNDIEKQIDDLVYILYGLTSNEIELIEQAN